MEAAATITRRPRRGRRAYVVLAGVALATLAAYFGYRFIHRNHISTDDAVVDADVVPISIRVGGVVREVTIRDHQTVHKGDLLIEIDPADYQVRVREAEADLAAARGAAAATDAQVRIVEATSTGGLSSARAQLAGTGSGVKTAHAQIEAVRAALVRAQAEARESETALARVRRLAARDAATTEEVEQAEAAGAAAAAAVSASSAQPIAAQEQERGARSRVAEAAGRVEQTGAVDAQVAAARAQAEVAAARVATAEASLERARLELSYTRVLAPVAGAASRLVVRAGQNVAPGQVALALVPPATYVVAHFKETDIARIRPGQRADVTVDALDGREVAGTVESISPATSSRFSLLQPDNATGNFVKVVKRVPVVITWSDGGEDLGVRPGMSVEVTVHVN